MRRHPIPYPPRIVAAYRTVCTITGSYSVTFSTVPQYSTEGLELGLPPSSVEIRREWLEERRKRADEFRESRLKTLRERRKQFEEAKAEHVEFI